MNFLLILGLAVQVTFRAYFTSFGLHETDRVPTTIVMSILVVPE
jgi:hypothetical protein